MLSPCPGADPVVGLASVPVAGLVAGLVVDLVVDLVAVPVAALASVPVVDLVVDLVAALASVPVVDPVVALASVLAVGPVVDFVPVGLLHHQAAELVRQLHPQLWQPLRPPHPEHPVSVLRLVTFPQLWLGFTGQLARFRG